MSVDRLAPIPGADYATPVTTRPDPDPPEPRGMLDRARDHFGAADARREAGDGPVDPIELWGRRIGRALGLVGVLVLLYLLVAQLSSR